MSTGRPTVEYIESMLRRLAMCNDIEHITVVVKHTDAMQSHTFVSTADDAETRAMAGLLERAYQPLKKYKKDE